VTYSRWTRSSRWCASCQSSMAPPVSEQLGLYQPIQVRRVVTKHARPSTRRRSRAAELHAASVDDAGVPLCRTRRRAARHEPKIKGFVQPKSWLVDSPDHETVSSGVSGVRGLPSPLWERCSRNAKPGEGSVSTGKDLSSAHLCSRIRPPSDADFVASPSPTGRRENK